MSTIHINPINAFEWLVGDVVYTGGREYTVTGVRADGTVELLAKGEVREVNTTISIRLEPHAPGAGDDADPCARTERADDLTGGDPTP